MRGAPRARSPHAGALVAARVGFPDGVHAGPARARAECSNHAGSAAGNGSRRLPLARALLPLIDSHKVIDSHVIDSL